MKFKRLLAVLLRFGLTKKLRWGGRVTIFPSYKCNYKCSYCSLKVKGVFPKNNLLPLEDWKQFLLDYNDATRDNGGLKEVVLTGGEPTLLPYFLELAEWILFEKKWHLTIFSNLSNLSMKELQELRPSIRLRIGSTLHNHVDENNFNTRYKIINRIHRVDVEEILKPGEKKRLSYSKAKPYLTEWEIQNLVACIRISPDQTMHLTCRGACEKFCKYE